ncbi:hypothetical protein Psuf_017440 [Phytohabitans suffuscus]|uniref:Uncharacterized protein n=1 Tax=Phytohabitans suffuscus TaxID=624315 RepID=A0A6F8YEQ8_9ACTN|nr:hypothetical protein Psuf_017440 [Phytohabitans suffuscus]
MKPPPALVAQVTCEPSRALIAVRRCVGRSAQEGRTAVDAYETAGIGIRGMHPYCPAVTRVWHSQAS